MQTTLENLQPGARVHLTISDTDEEGYEVLHTGSVALDEILPGKGCFRAIELFPHQASKRARSNNPLSFSSIFLDSEIIVTDVDSFAN